MNCHKCDKPIPKGYCPLCPRCMTAATARLGEHSYEVLRLLMECRVVTQKLCHERLGTFALAQRIKDLRDYGIRIITEKVSERRGEPKRAHYFMDYGEVVGS